MKTSTLLKTAIVTGLLSVSVAHAKKAATPAAGDSAVVADDKASCKGADKASCKGSCKGHAKKDKASCKGSCKATEPTK